MLSELRQMVRDRQGYRVRGYREAALPVERRDWSALSEAEWRAELDAFLAAEWEMYLEAPAVAQQISGRVTDSLGTAIPEARVTVYSTVTAAFLQPRPDVDPCSDTRTYYMLCLEKLGTNVVIQDEASSAWR